ncbi:hypothetical protein DM01DRAFT_1407806 [Hesseltinella vesiculosa]|uniref:Uncharacterized protein n=1 Tax=Hesseltinella vesiculosa TaxID=101127 RepID=A0A1X2GHB6_9FUNG|nr:hypothetical protein DM01DRAFT_1407806 [Hesseltinella vesiculosa]
MEPKPTESKLPSWNPISTRFNEPTKSQGFLGWLASLFLSKEPVQLPSPQTTPNMLSSSSSTSTGAHPQLNSTSDLSESTLWVDDVPVMGNIKHPTPWAFYDWLRQLPRLAFLHLLSNTIIQQPEWVYPLLVYQFDQERTLPPTCLQLESDDDQDIIQELAWLQLHARAIVHQHDRLRPNEQFARVDHIAESVLSLIRICAMHSTASSWPSLLALLLIAMECLDAPSQVRQHLFYRARLGRALILEITTVLKNYQEDPNDVQDVILPLTRQQLLLARQFFPPASTSSPTSSAYEDPDEMHAWYITLQYVCGTMASLDTQWIYHQDYHQAVTIASALFMPSYPL